MTDMIGVGPFITLPLIVGAMGGPQAMLGWIAGAVFAMCDGLIWAELGAAMPGSGGSYQYLREIYGRNRWGKLISFLFIWQLSFSRSTVNRFRLDWTGGVCVVLLAEPGDRIRGAQLEYARSSP